MCTIGRAQFFFCKCVHHRSGPKSKDLRSSRQPELRIQHARGMTIDCWTQERFGQRKSGLGAVEDCKVERGGSVHKLVKASADSYKDFIAWKMRKMSPHPPKLLRSGCHVEEGDPQGCEPHSRPGNPFANRLDHALRKKEITLLWIASQWGTPCPQAFPRHSFHVCLCFEILHAATSPS